MGNSGHLEKKDPAIIDGKRFISPPKGRHGPCSQEKI
jgi:hypothetical protein